MPGEMVLSRESRFSLRPLRCSTGADLLRFAGMALWLPGYLALSIEVFPVDPQIQRGQEEQK